MAGKHGVSMRKPPALDALVALFKAPAKEHKLIANWLAAAVQTAGQRGKNWKPPTVSTLKALQRAKTTLRAAAEALHELPPNLPRAAQRVFVHQPFGSPYLLALELQHLADALGDEYGERRPRFGPGKLDWTALDHLVWSMLIVAHKTGGRLSFHEKHRRGTLVDLLEGLRKYLPQDFIPPLDNLPWRRLGRLTAEFRKYRP